MSSTKVSIKYYLAGNSIKHNPTFKQLKSMTAPSECIFCQIIRREAPASIIYEDEQVIAFLSNRPVNPGHTLVTPKKHYENIYEIPVEEAGHLFKIAKHVAPAVRDAKGAEGIRIVQNNGEAAGQVVFHLHVHVIPMEPHNRFSHDGAFRDLTYPRNIGSLENDAQEIKQRLNKD
jgi:histidine triad (HIT) family protein